MRKTLACAFLLAFFFLPVAAKAQDIGWSAGWPKWNATAKEIQGLGPYTPPANPDAGTLKIKFHWKIAGGCPQSSDCSTAGSCPMIWGGDSAASPASGLYQVWATMEWKVNGVPDSVQTSTQQVRVP